MQLRKCWINCLGRLSGFQRRSDQQAADARKPARGVHAISKFP
jgi:hypothetical protein